MDLINREKALGCFDGWEDDHGGWHDADELPGYDKLQALPIVAEVEDCISRQAAINAVVKESQIDGAYGYMDTKSIVDLLSDLPSAQPETQRATWTLHTYMPHHYYCTHCNKDSPYNKIWDFCPHCGYKMEDYV